MPASAAGGISDPTLLRLAEMRRQVAAGEALTIDVLLGLTEIVASLASVVATLAPPDVTPPPLTGGKA